MIPPGQVGVVSASVRTVDPTVLSRALRWRADTAAHNVRDLQTAVATGDPHRRAIARQLLAYETSIREACERRTDELNVGPAESLLAISVLSSYVTWLRCSWQPGDITAATEWAYAGHMMHALILSMARMLDPEPTATR